MYNLGLIGKNISHSFSKEYFEKKFKENNITDFSYSLFPLETLNHINHFIKSKKIVGLNVTSPYKENIIKHLDKLGPTASITKSVNTIFITPQYKKIGFNTDLFGFKSILEKLNTKNKKALILGSGGVSKTISYSLDLTFFLLGLNTTVGSGIAISPASSCILNPDCVFGLRLFIIHIRLFVYHLSACV